MTKPLDAPFLANSLDGPPDDDPLETEEWVESLVAVVEHQGQDRAVFLLNRLEERAQQLGLIPHVPPYSAYRNTIPVEMQGEYPGDLALEERITAIIRWNALAMVGRANRASTELGGHIATFASAAEIFEVGFNHFFKGNDCPGGADLVFFQPHSAPGVYARAFLEGRITEKQLANYRQEVKGVGLSSYPHPWLMPEFWQFPTGSMGLGPVSAIHHARFMRYLQQRGLADTTGRRVWGLFGDGEMDEPESTSALSLAARDGLENLIFVVNCNLQRLDGPVRGNGQIIQELEARFIGAGWNVIKVLWGSDWDPLFARDTHHALLRRFAATVDGKYQTLGAKDGAYNLANFFQEDPEVGSLVSHLSTAEIEALKRGGHDLRKLYAAFSSACAHRGGPTVILAKTKKGYGMGRAGQCRMEAHQAKKLDAAALQGFRDTFQLALSDQDIDELRFYRPAEDAPELAYLRSRRAALGGFVPAGRRDAPRLDVPARSGYAAFALEPRGREMSTTVAAVRMIGNLLKEPTFGPRIVPIIADEGRTFGMASLFRQVGIYSPVGQLYEPEDAGSTIAYREATDGQILEEGISEASAISSWIAAATSYAVHGVPMLPFYIYYSMFGFQRVGDLIWAAADQHSRGFLLGATSGRTTLGGEGLQHQDGNSHVLAATNPSCRSYDPTFSCELAVILDYGMRRMLEAQADEFYYVTLMNESYPQITLPQGAEDGIVRGMYRLLRHEGPSARGRVRLLGSGAILREVIAAGELLDQDWHVGSDVYSVTSFAELAREARQVERWSRLHPQCPREASYVERTLDGDLPIIAASDYVRAYPQLISSYVRGRFVALGTDGFGRSDTRRALRNFFEVDRYHIVIAALDALAQDGVVDRGLVLEAIVRYGVDAESAAPWTC